MSKPSFVVLQYIIPQHFLSRMIGHVMNSRNKFLKNRLIKWFVKRYQVDMSVAAEENPFAYDTFNDFFIRHLKKESRPIDENEKAVVSPADGTISQIGFVEKNKIFQAKEIYYSLHALLGGGDWAKEFFDGRFATVYLSPKDYHRVHMPASGKLIAMRYIPGHLFSVNGLTTDHIPGLFARNERAVCLFDTPQGKMAIIMVGAMIVASIHTTWAGQITPSKESEITTIDYSSSPLSFNKGEEMGYFCLGSTAIILFANQTIQWDNNKVAGTPIKMGEQIGIFG